MKRKPTAQPQTSRPSLKSSAGIRCAAYSLPARSVAITDLAAAGLVSSTPEQLGHLGFRRIYMADGETAYDLARNAVTTLLKQADVEANKIDALIYASA